MIKISLVILPFVLILNSPITSANSFICVPEKSTGFSNNGGTDGWAVSQFKATEKYILLKNPRANTEPYPERCKWCDDNYYQHLWMVKKIGNDDFVLAWCRDGYDTYTGKRRADGFTGRTGKNDDYLVCDKSGSDIKFRFSKKNMRFMLLGTSGYWDEGHIDADKSDPFMEIGKCSTIE